MKEILLKDLKEFVYYDAPLMLDENYIILSPHVSTTPEIIKTLDKWKIRKIYTTGEGVGRESSLEIESTGASTLDVNVKEKEGKERAFRFFKGFTTFIDEVFQNFLNAGVLDMNRLSQKVKETINLLREDSDYILRLQEYDGTSSSYIITHSAKTTVLALAIGERLKLPNHKLIELGLAAILHEIGMLKLPPSLYQTDRILNPMEKKAMNTHPVLGYRLLKEMTLPRDLILGVLEHHEHMDGSGYPQHMHGENISQFGRIIAVACDYDGQVSRRPFRDQLKDGHAAMLDMIAHKGKYYDEQVLANLVLTLSLYPLGSYVSLENGFIAQVIKTNSSSAKYPIVKLLFDDKRLLIKDSPVVKTGEDKGYFIKAVMAKEEVMDLLKQSRGF